MRWDKIMSKSVNKCILVGRLGKDAETTNTSNGNAVTKFSIATDRGWKDKATGEWKSETDWHNCVAWQKSAVAPYLLKGTQVYVEGRLQTRSYDKDGERRYVTEVVADEIVLLGSKREGSGSTG